MDYALPSHQYHTTAELGGSDLFSVPIQSAQEQINAHNLGLAGVHGAGDQTIASESQINQVVANLNNAAKSQTLVNVPNVQVPKVKRQDDVWTGK